MGAAIVIIIAAYFVFGTKHTSEPRPTTMETAAFDPLSATYLVDGTAVTLKDGVSVVVIPGAKDPGATMKTTTRIFGEPNYADLNKDGAPDAFLLLVQDTGGSGSFFYIAAALNKNGSAIGTDAILLGDRIAPQNIQIQNSEIIVNYADRKPNEPFAVPPSVGVSKYFAIQGDTLVAMPNPSK